LGAFPAKADTGFSYRNASGKKMAPLSMESGRFIRNGLARENHGEHHFFSKQPIAGF
jgi:hypothetical protein